MDDIVKQALTKWPNVPHCYGWLGLDARGNWYLRDAQAQAAGAFPRSKGSLLEHEKLIEFIGRNYEHDDAGQWFFQNGPQRVYVELDLSPWVFRVNAGGLVTTHTGVQVQPDACLVDEQGRVYLTSALGLGLIHSMDVAVAADLIEAGTWVPEPVDAKDLPARFGFLTSPATAQAP